ncbi:MAG: DUF1015 domain-containing protein [Bdellovibrionales bacterium]|nr:DUF1015 domain-containing protein [Bdellovibrionales bacterium]
MIKPMPVQPFKAYRYQDHRDMCNKICPPYDVVDQKEFLQLSAHSPFNAIHLTLNDPKAMDLDKKRSQQDFQKVQLLWNSWVEDKILQQDARTQYYQSRDHFSVDQKTYARNVLYALVHLDPKHGPKIIPHERVLELPIQDRLKLLSQTQVQTSPIYLIFDDVNEELHGMLSQNKDSMYSCRHPKENSQSFDFFVYDQEKEIENISSILSQGNFLVADGHHRLETTRRYYQNAGKESSAYVFAAIVSSKDPGVFLSSIHRGWESSTNFLTVVERLSTHFDIQEIHRDWDSFLASGAQMALDVLDRKKIFALTYKARDQTNEENITLEVPSVLLNHYILEEQYGIHLDQSKDQKKMNYLNSLEAVQNYVIQDSKRVACWLRPLTFESLQKICSKGYILPQKSTFFYPKIMSGFLFYKIDS